ncbi:L-serine ammonia-lyase, iron-sulfur-dependent, subunit alpha [Lachnospiraceae bacterium OttesenSCG-928-J05]|nr:L-serine ammonia-lyase, iron-sulfur-dependent, subunit alpha [Lachnospiraceae bacterium OttesenSCG-928-J05]
MHPLTNLIKNDMKPAHGVTEPGAIAFAVAAAREHLRGPLATITVELNSGLYKNAFTCGIPGCEESGNLFAAALGGVWGDSAKGLEILSGVGTRERGKAHALITEGRVQVLLKDISSDIFIRATVTSATDTVVLEIKDSHTQIHKIVVNDTVIFEENRETSAEKASATAAITNYSLSEFIDYVKGVPTGELEFITDAFILNMDLFDEGLRSDRTTFIKYLFEKNGNQIISKNEENTALLLGVGAIEARVLGLDKPAMSITGSGAHGIIATLPFYGVYKAGDYKKEQVLRATALSFLICMYIKEYSGKLSAFCGCAIAAGCGAACGLSYLKGGSIEKIENTINNFASGITGMICDGGNQGCVMKGVTAIDSAFRASAFALKGLHIDAKHGILGSTPEATMRNMGRIASPGMTATEGEIVRIMEGK